MSYVRDGPVMRQLSRSTRVPLIRDGPNTTTTIFEFISQSPVFDFGAGIPRKTQRSSSDVPSTADLMCLSDSISWG